MTTVRLPRGKRVHELDERDPTATLCEYDATTCVLVDAPVSCKRCKERRR